MSRRGTTVLEGLVAATLGLFVLAALFAVARLAARSDKVSAQAGALTDAALVLATLERDLIRAVPGTGVAFSPGSLGLAVQRRGADGALTADRVVYTKVDAGSGRWRLTRTASGQRSWLPGLFSAVDVTEWRAAGGPFVRVTLTAEDQLLGSLVRIGSRPISTH